MLNENSQRTLSQLFMRIIEGENKVEILRKCLCENYDFSPRVLFRSLCRVYSDSLLPKDLKEFSSQNGEEANDPDCYLLVKQYSSLQNGRLSEEDFSHFVLSATNDTLPYLVTQRLHIFELKAGVKYSFLSLLKEELKLHREVEALKVQLFKDPEFSLWKAFEHLNSANKGYISEADVTNFLQKRGRFISQNDYDSLMRRIDLEDDLVISYNEFLEALIPMQVPKQEFRSSPSKPLSESSRGESWKERSVEKHGQESASFGQGNIERTQKAKKEVANEDRPFKAEDLEASYGVEENKNREKKAKKIESEEDLKENNERVQNKESEENQVVGEGSQDKVEDESQGRHVEGSQEKFEERSQERFEGGSQERFEGGSQQRFEEGSQERFEEDNQERFEEGSQEREYENNENEDYKDEDEEQNEELDENDLENLSDQEDS